MHFVYKYNHEGINLTNKILQFLNFDINYVTQKDIKFGGIYLNKEALKRCKFTQKMTTEDVIKQLSIDTTYFVGDCKETGCIPINFENTMISASNGRIFNWDKIWSSNYTNFKIIKFRIEKIKKRGIKILNKCGNKNPLCMWFNHPIKDEYLNIYNNISS